MDSLTMKSIKDLKQTYQNDENENAQDNLLSIMQDALESISSKSISTLDEIRYKLEQVLGYEQPEDRKSYTLGMVHGFAQFLNYWILHHQREQMITDLSQQEKLIIRAISNHPHITPADLLEVVGENDNQQINNHLRQLQLKELVSCWEGGTHRYYDITTIGEKALKTFESPEQ